MVYSLAVQSAVSLLVAHLIGDFLVQTEKDVAQKTRLPILLKHAAILAALSYALTGIWRCWEIPAVIFLAHLVFDYVKSRFTSNGALSIAIDQVAHLLTIAFLAAVLLPLRWPDELAFWPTLLGPGYLQALIAAGGWVMCARVGQIAIELFVAPLHRELLQAEVKSRRKASELETQNGFADGGRIIGVLERTLIYLLVMVDMASGIGFLIAAKSIFRFGEIKDRTNRMEAEYILIGTLASFAYAMVIAYGSRWLIFAVARWEL